MDFHAGRDEAGAGACARVWPRTSLGLRESTPINSAITRITLGGLAIRIGSIIIFRHFCGREASAVALAGPGLHFPRNKLREEKNHGPIERSVGVFFPALYAFE